jgi:hypothetical protein
MLILLQFFDWLGSNLAYMMFALSMLFLFILIIYIKFFFRTFYPGTHYRHYRKGRLLEESDQGGKVILIPLIDRLEVFDDDDDENNENAPP